MTIETTHPSLLAGAADPGNRRAWRRLEATYGPVIIAFCRSLGLQLADAEDVRQEVLLNLSSALKEFQYDPARGRFRHYLARAVRNAAMRLAARHAGAAQPLQNDVIESLAVEDESALNAHWDAQWVRHHCRLAMEALRKEAQPLHVEALDQLLAGRSIAEVSQIFQISLEHVRKIKQRLKDRLHELVSDQIKREEAGHD